jgi:hypothetical protein
MRRSSKSIARARSEVAFDDVSGDVSPGGDRGLWLLERCPACGASPGARCRPVRGASRQPILHVARGWRQRRCPVCRAVARVRFAGGGGRRASVETVVAAAGGGELARWGAGEGELGDALAAPVWARYGAFRGQPPITGTLCWSVAERSITLAGRRGSERFAETLAGGAAIRSGRDVSRDASAVSALERWACERCGGPIAPSARSEARYCSKRCRRAASRVRLRELWGPPARVAPERCGWCEDPMPPGLRSEARYCSKRCRQAASRARLAEARGRGRGSRTNEPTPSDTSRDTSLLGSPLPPGARRRAR